MNAFPHGFPAIAAVFLASHLYAGVVSYAPVPPTGSDAGSGINNSSTYTSAVYAGGRDAAPVSINGVTLSPLIGEGQTMTGNGLTISVATGALTPAGLSATIQADGVFGSTLNKHVLNTGAEPGSEQYLVLDVAHLQAGVTYELRVYVANASGQNRQISFTFAGDGKTPVEMDYFNEDDATTSEGGFPDPNQVYYISYRFTWDGLTVPGVTVTQRDPGAPFCFYALTNQVVATAPGQGITLDAPAPEPAGQPAPAPAPASVAEAPSDDVGVESEVFYKDPGLQKHGHWVNVEGYGNAWEPTEVSPEWAPYTVGSWAYADDAGWTWASDEDWGWATYHYGRWLRHAGGRWCWVPGRVWAPAWVSWRYGGSYAGWAPLPPAAGFRASVGIGGWADRAYGIGPMNYNFVSVGRFGAPNVSGVIIDRSQNVTVINRTTNITNIANNNSTIYSGGPNHTAVNNIIQHTGGRIVPMVKLDRHAADILPNGRHGDLHNGVLSVASPAVNPGKNLQPPGKTGTTIAKGDIDHGWRGVQDQNLARQAQAHIDAENAGQTPQNAPATLPKSMTAGRGTLTTSGKPGNVVVVPGQTGTTTAKPGNAVIKPGDPVNKLGNVSGRATTTMEKPGKTITKPGDPVAKPGNVSGQTVATPQKPGNQITGETPAGVEKSGSAPKTKGGVPPESPATGAAQTPTGVQKPGTTTGPNTAVTDKPGSSAVATPKPARPGTKRFERQQQRQQRQQQQQTPTNEHVETPYHPKPESMQQAPVEKTMPQTAPVVRPMPRQAPVVHPVPQPVPTATVYPNKKKKNVDDN